MSDDRASANGHRVGLLGVGALVSVALALLRGASIERGDRRGSDDVPVDCWIADRDGCAVYGADEDSILVRRVEVDWPIALAARPDGGAWILRSDTGSASGRSRLVRIDARGTVRAEVVLGTCADLAALEDGSAIVLERSPDDDAADRVVRCRADGEVEVLFRGFALAGCAGSKGSIAVGDARGIVRLVSPDPPGSVIARVDLREPVLQIESDPIDGRSWVLTASDAATIHRLETDLTVRWSAEAGSPSTSLATDAERGRIWLVDGARSTVRRLDEDGIVDATRADPSIVRSSRGAGRSSGGIVIASPGCLLHLDPDGNLRPGQGGFAHLVDVESVR